jgi:glycosyltransferase involved in cell wall biosynthesis
MYGKRIKIMNILFLFISYPEDANSTNLTKDLSDEFNRQGDNVYVATIRERKLNLETQISSENGINVLRIKNGNMFNNISKFEKLYTMITMNKNILKQIKKYWGDIKFDLIVGTTPYMANAKLINGLKNHYHCPSFLILWDIFPQNAKDLELIKSKLIFNFFKKQENKNLKSFDYIGCMSQGNIDYVRKNYDFIDKKQLYLFPLWSKIKKLEFLDKREIREKYHFNNDDFILVFGGNMGKPQSLTNVINLASQVQEYNEIKFLFVGQGTEVKSLKKQLKELKLLNVIFKDFIPREEYEKLIFSCDVGILSLDKRFTIPNFPSKSVDYLKLGLPILASLDKCSLDDYGYLLENVIKAGLVCEATDTTKYKDNLLRLFNDKKLYKKLSKNGRQYYEKMFNVENNYKIIKAILGDKVV